MKEQKTYTEQKENCEKIDQENSKGEQRAQDGDDQTNCRCASVKGFEGIYEVDTEGRIRSYRCVRKNEGQTIGEKRRELRPRVKRYKSGEPILCITLYHPSRRKYHYNVAKLVYGTFYGSALKYRDDKAVIHHIDGDTFNNRLDNLKKMKFREAKQASIDLKKGI